MTGSITPEAVEVALWKHPKFTDTFNQLAEHGGEIAVGVVGGDVLRLDITLPDDGMAGHAEIAFADHADAAGVAATAYKRVADVVRVLRATAV